MCCREGSLYNWIEGFPKILGDTVLPIQLLTCVWAGGAAPTAIEHNEVMLIVVQIHGLLA